MSVYPVPDVQHLWDSLPAESVASALAEPSTLTTVLRDALHVALPNLDIEYIEHVVVGAMLTSLAIDQRPVLPMLDTANFSKSAALPHFLWGLLYDAWQPEPSTGTTLFVTGYLDRNVATPSNPHPPSNLRKRIYWSAVTADLMPLYSTKITGFFTQLLDDSNANQPLMALYLGSYYKDLYWDLHLGLTAADVPAFSQQIGQSFNIVLANATPTMQLVYDNYLQVRALRPQLNSWLTAQISRLATTPDPSTLVHYWLQNSALGTDPNFRTADIMFECFHDFVALSQWGNTIYNTIKLLNVDDGSANVRAAFRAAMQSTSSDTVAFDSLDRFIMELFRFINPNSASISTFDDPPLANSPFEQYRYVFTPHAEASSYELHWTNPQVFDPDRFLTTPLAAHNDEARSAEIGFAQCPFTPESFTVQDGRNVQIANSIFGTTYPVVDGVDSAVCDYAGYAPFGFGYRRCPGELLNVRVIRDFLQLVWDQKIEFHKLPLTDPVQQPVGPLTVVPDIYGFERVAPSIFMA
ncbi:MAG: cytochrome P450 [Ilumatobacteraceae bacterium]|nr:cytochrome P450 [Ilumatobacteraceae bacterium]